MQVLIPTTLLAFAVSFTLSFGATTSDQDDHDETPLAKAMLEIEDGLRILRRSVRDPENLQDSLAAVATCQAASHLCKLQAPAMAAGVAEDKRAAFVSAYRLEMIRFERALLNLEEALLQSKDVDTLRELYKVLKEMEDPAHEQFTEGG